MTQALSFLPAEDRFWSLTAPSGKTRVWIDANATFPFALFRSSIHPFIGGTLVLDLEDFFCILGHIALEKHFSNTGSTCARVSYIHSFHLGPPRTLPSSMIRSLSSKVRRVLVMSSIFYFFLLFPPHPHTHTPTISFFCLLACLLSTS